MPLSANSEDASRLFLMSLRLNVSEYCTSNAKRNVLQIQM